MASLLGCQNLPKLKLHVHDFLIGIRQPVSDLQDHKRKSSDLALATESITL